MSILTRKIIYLIKTNSMLNTWCIWHSRGFFDFINVINALKISHLNITDSDYNFNFNDMALLKQDKILFHYFLN